MERRTFLQGAGGTVLAGVVAPGATVADEKPTAKRIKIGQIGVGRESGFTLADGGSDRPFVARGALEFVHDFASLRISGAELFKKGAAVARALGIGVDVADHVIPHQVNGHMAELLGAHFGIEPRRVFVNADRLGNTGSAAIWLALAELRPSLEPGATVLALGAEATKYMFGGFSYVHG